MLNKKSIVIILSVILLMLISISGCSASKAGENTLSENPVNADWGFTPTQFTYPVSDREPGNAEEYFFFDGLELGTKYKDIAGAINKDGIFGAMAEDPWNEELEGSHSISGSAITSDKNYVDTTLVFSKEDYFDEFQLRAVGVVLKMDATQPDINEFVNDKDALLEKFIKDENLTEMKKIPEGEIPDECDSYRDGYLSEGYTSELFEGYVYDDEETRTRYYFVAAYYTKNDPDSSRSEDSIIAELIFRKTLYPKTYSLVTK